MARGEEWHGRRVMVGLACGAGANLAFERDGGLRKELTVSKGPLTETDLPRLAEELFGAPPVSPAVLLADGLYLYVQPEAAIP